MELEEHLFRREAGRLVAILTRLFGVHNLALAEDVVQDAFCQALETWKFHGPPRNPSSTALAMLPTPDCSGGSVRGSRPCATSWAMKSMTWPAICCDTSSAGAKIVLSSGVPVSTIAAIL